MTAFLLMKKSKEANWPSGVVNWGRFSSLKRLESIFVRGVRIILFIMEKSFELYSSSFLDIGTKFKPLLSMDFSESESRRFCRIVTTLDLQR